jgi:hypothetical protein
VRPEPGVFLEYAPIHRSYDTPYAEQTGPEVTEPIELLDANLELFPADTAQVLEYWLDVSRWSGWKRPAVSVPWHPAVFRADVEAYAARGIRHVTTFAVWIDADYVAMHGPPPVDDYGRGLAGLG